MIDLHVFEPNTNLIVSMTMVGNKENKKQVIFIQRDVLLVHIFDKL